MNIHWTSFSSLSLENLKKSSELEQVPQFNKIHNRRVHPTRAFPSQDNLEQDTLKKSPSTPNLNWRYAVTEDIIRANSGGGGSGGGGRGGGEGGGGGGHGQEIVVKRRPKKAPRPRPRSEFRERGSDETWIDGDRWERERERQRVEGEWTYFLFEGREDPGVILSWKEADRIIIFRPASNLWVSSVVIDWVS